jgi:hypothetical protein
MSGGQPMLTIVRHPGGLGWLRVELRCELCQGRLSIFTAWLAFPPIYAGKSTTGRWLHKRCLDGSVASVFGTAGVPLMRADSVFQRLAASMSDTNTSPVVVGEKMRCQREELQKAIQKACLHGPLQGWLYLRWENGKDQHSLRILAEFLPLKHACETRAVQRG